MSHHFLKPDGPIAINRDHALFKPNYYFKGMGIATPAGMYDPYHRKTYAVNGTGEYRGGGWRNTTNNRIYFDLGASFDPDTDGGLGIAALFVGRIINLSWTDASGLLFANGTTATHGSNAAGFDATLTTNYVAFAYSGFGGPAAGNLQVGDYVGPVTMLLSSSRDTSIDPAARFIFKISDNYYEVDQAGTHTGYPSGYRYITVGEASKAIVCQLDFFAAWGAGIPQGAFYSLAEDPYQLLDAKSKLLPGDANQAIESGAAIRNRWAQGRRY